MPIRNRIVLLIIQLSVLLLATYLATNQIIANEIWFFSGLLAIIINPTLLEPWYPKSVDTLGNSIIALILTYVSSPTVAITGWVALRFFLIGLIIFSVVNIIISTREGRLNNYKLNSFIPLYKIGKSIVIYSLVFWMDLLELYNDFSNPFWILSISWAILILLGIIKWQNVRQNNVDKPVSAVPLSIVGPTNLMVTSSNLPKVDSRIEVSYGSVISKGILVKRIARADNIWGQIQLDDAEKINWLVGREQVKVKVIDRESEFDGFIGNVNEGTNTYQIVFNTNQHIELGETVYIQNDGQMILYQIIFGEIIKFDVKSGSQFDRKIKAFQIGSYDIETQELLLKRTLPDLSCPIFKTGNIVTEGNSKVELENKFQLGKIKSTDWKINLDVEKVKESHIAILGMTGMGKTSLCDRLIKEIAKTRRVTILDQSGEFVSKRGYAKYKSGDDDIKTGVSVCEPDIEPPKSALKYLEFIITKAKGEYEKGEPIPRVIVIDEAHQFIPEPAGLGFGTVGREESMKFGLSMMQVRKYGISIIFISQRTAVVSKSALSQCENLIAFKSVDQTGLDYLEGILGEGSRTLLPSLNRGEALVFGPAIDTEKSVVIETFLDKK